jgi:hypothetical protein
MGTVSSIDPRFRFTDIRAPAVKGPSPLDTVPSYSEWTHTKHFKYYTNSNFATGFAFKISNKKTESEMFTMSYVISRMDTNDLRMATGNVNMHVAADGTMVSHYNLAKASMNTFASGNIQLARLIQGADGRYIFFPASQGGSMHWYLRLTIETMTVDQTGVCLPVNPVPVYPANLPAATSSIDISLAVA